METLGYTPETMEIVATRVDPDVEITPYQESWPQTFTEVAARIESVLGSSALKLQHVGSTSVPGLAAKPIIDILVEVSDPADEAAYLPQLESLGLVLLFRQRRWHGHRFLAISEHGAEVNVHIHRKGCQVAADFPTFRDFLRENAWARDEYAEAKRQAAETSNSEKGGRLRYQMEKAEVLERLKAMALKEKPSPCCTDCRIG